MEQQAKASIRIREASEHNLKGISLDIPHFKFVVVTGVSGSGKSSLAFDLIAREGQRRYLETFSGFSRQFLGKMSRPQVEMIEGLSPVITIGQKTVGSSIRSTVGTVSDLYDHLRLLFARLGQGPVPLTRSLFSFNSPTGACPNCTGLGLEEKISLDKLLADPSKTLREGALAPTLPNGYIMYSQVTVDVLDQVCQAHGFNVDIPWNQLLPEQQEVILNGSTRLKVPFGKHSLESRLKWTGIDAKPREEGFYKGMIPIMSDILRRDRNKNILKYAVSLPCSVCQGKRLKSEALAVQLQGKSIDQLAAMELSHLKKWLQTQNWEGKEKSIAGPVVEKMCRQIELLEKLGVAYLSLDRPAPTLTGGESQRIRLVNQVSAQLSHVLYVFDEPSIGLHPRDNQHLLEVLRELVALGNTVLVVEHDEATIRQADWIIDIGPDAGIGGGELLFNGPVMDFLSATDLHGKSPTYDVLHREASPRQAAKKSQGQGWILLKGCRQHNLKSLNARFKKAAFNVVTGVSGAGKSSLIHHLLKKAMARQLAGESLSGLQLDSAEGLNSFVKLVSINQAPIGRTPRSNPATYTGLATRIRDLFAKTDAAKVAKFSKSRFSFNNKGGRCETCQGAGRIQVGMHFLGNVDVTCATCEGKRFNEATLAIQYQGLNINQVFELSIDQALGFFQAQKPILHQLQTLQSLGLGYLSLGQPSTTLSGGEAQRIKLATELQHSQKGEALYLLDEPSVGLHLRDVGLLCRALRGLVDQGHTVICIEHDAAIIRMADWMLDLGPDSGVAGGQLMFEGLPEQIPHDLSPTAKALHTPYSRSFSFPPSQIPAKIKLHSVATHHLKNIDVEIPRNQLTLITGLSGSGKSSLAFDTLFAEANSRFTESFSTYARSLIRQSKSAVLESSEGLGPVVAIGRQYLSRSPRSTVGTNSGIFEHYRLLFARFAQQQNKTFTAQHFSFNHQLGACPDCDGLGERLTCNPLAFFDHPEHSILKGALAKNKRARFYGNAQGQYMAILKEVAKTFEIDLSQPLESLSEKEKQLIFFGTGDQIWKLTWRFQNKTRSGEQEVAAPWMGFCNYIDDEFRRKQQNKNTQALQDLLHAQSCDLCGGSRLKNDLLAVKCLGKSIADLNGMTVTEAIFFFEEEGKGKLSRVEAGIFGEIKIPVLAALNTLQELGLAYLSLDRKTDSLSGGEGGRLRLASQLSSKLFGVTYVLDEPSIGLDAQAVESLLQVLRRLIRSGNTVVLVEHDESMIRAADHLIELGPGAGRQGGQVIYQGPLPGLLTCGASPTAKFLRNPTQPAPFQTNLEPKSFGIRSAHRHNLKNIDLDFTSGGIIALTGKSGSGKSTLAFEVLLASVEQGRPIGCESVYGLGQFDRIVSVDQRPVSSNSLSSPATFTGLMDELRKGFAATDSAKAMGLKRSAFSYHHKDGKCPTCNGFGQQRTSMDFMADIWTVCEACAGDRYRAEVRAIQWLGLSIGETLQLTVAEARLHFESVNKLAPPLGLLDAVGLGHIQLGQAGNTLSGGEAQRLKLAAELIGHRHGRNLYLFDEPSTGLHFQDLLRIIDLFQSLVAEGHSILFIEHHPLLIGIAHQVVELGPEGGEKGGYLLSSD